ncbi:rhomboid family intramembrane serine protease [Chitinimonas lacunae]|uniref:Rhomboid family intramembrane serine protease n=1 Tax=Chitinimonas lacunae TaxID=1963018 RepID=A0ABV8MS26_9NEIS
MLLLPLPARPDWRRPPIVTLGIIVVCTVILLLFQFKDGPKEAAAMAFYNQSVLPAKEIPLYLDDLARRGKKEELKQVRSALDDPEVGPGAVAGFMQLDSRFIARLHAGQIIKPDDPDYARWRHDRREYERLHERVFTNRYSLRPGDPTIAGLIGHMFLHADPMHLLGNMVVLFIVGYTVEAALGSLLFLVFYLLAGFGATATDLLLYRDQIGLSLGASGAIAGVMAMYVVLYGLRKIRFFYSLLFFFSTAELPALLVLPMWIGNELLQQYVFNPGDNVNYLAHFSGFVSGALLTALYRWRRGGRSADKVHADDQAQTLAHQIDGADQLVQNLQFERAAVAYRAIVTLKPDDPSLIAEYFRLAKLAPKSGQLPHAIERLLALSAGRPHSADPTMIADALRESTKAELPLPKLTYKAWATLVRLLIDGRELDVAEKLVLMLSRRPGEPGVLPPLLFRLAQAFIDDGKSGRAERYQRLLMQLHPDSDEAQWLEAARK